MSLIKPTKADSWLCYSFNASPWQVE